MAGRVYTKDRSASLKHKFTNLGVSLEAGKIKTWDQVFAFIDPTPMSLALDIPYKTFLKKVADPDSFKLGDFKAFAKLAGVDVSVIIAFMLQVKPKK
jgi:hypothetical protein